MRTMELEIFYRITTIRVIRRAKVIGHKLRDFCRVHVSYTEKQ